MLLNDNHKAFEKFGRVVVIGNDIVTDKRKEKENRVVLIFPFFHCLE